MPVLEMVFILLLGLAAGLTAGIFFTRLSFKAYHAPEKVRDMEQSIWTTEQQAEHLRDQCAELQQNLGSMSGYRDEAVRMQEENRHLKAQLTGQREELQKLYAEMTERFELLAGQTLEKNSEAFGKRQQERLSLLLDPLKDKIHHFEKKVEETHRVQSGETKSLRDELKRMESLNLQMQEDAKNLTLALKGDQKMQGHWGEIVLERILQASGLNEGQEYVRQKSHTINTEEGIRRQRPDIIINLPGDRQLIIDSKVSLKAYEGCQGADNETDRQRFLKKHLTSIRSHIEGLSKKYYYQLQQVDSPEFVLLFLPIEASYSLAFRDEQTDLFSYAWSRKVIVVSPTTLMATLQTIGSLWKNEKQHRNALKIAEEGGKLYDKLYNFMKELEKVGKHIDLSAQSYSDAMKKLHEGRGNLMDKAEKLRELGISTKKSLDDFQQS